VQLSCIKTNNISNRTETIFYMTHVTYEFYRVLPKRFLRLWYVWCKLWIYLAPRLSLSPNGPKWDSTWPMSPRSSIGCVQNDFCAYGMFSASRAPILNQDYHYLQTNQNELPFEPRHVGVPSGVSKMISEPMVRFVTNCAPILDWNWHCLQTDRNELPFEPRHLEVPSSASKIISERMLYLAQTVHLSCTKTYTISKRTERRFYVTHVT
jgi:hypothetical protein